jgi:hypothetical protein
MASKAPEEPPLRWSLAQAAREFDVAKESLRRKLGDTHQEPGADGRFSTKQLTTALYGDLYGARLPTQNEAAEKLRLENAIMRGEVVNRAKLSAAFAQLADALRQCVMNSELDRRAKEDFLRNLATWPVTLENVVEAQTRLPRGNDTRPESEGEER